MKYTFSEYFIKENECLFYIYLGIMAIIIILAIIFVIRELKKNGHK